MQILQSLQNWYQRHCDGDWEHSFGVEIQTLDNPGWSVRINLVDTELEELEFSPVSEVDGQDNPESGRWIECFVRDSVWHGVGDETKLERILTEFLNWANGKPFEH